jgi:hypothetical protein
VKRPQRAGTARTLNTADPTIVPTPMSESLIKVPQQLMNNSGDDVAIAMKVAPATSSLKCNPEEESLNLEFQN